MARIVGRDGFIQFNIEADRERRFVTAVPRPEVENLCTIGHFVDPKLAKRWAWPPARNVGVQT